MKSKFVYCLLFVLLTVSCYNQPKSEHDALAVYSEAQIDSLSFQSTHHFTKNFNFVVDCDSLRLSLQEPEEIVNEFVADSSDFVYVYKYDNVVVADIENYSNDPVDSVWIKLARDQETIGWIHESEMLPFVVPDDPISQFINIFSNIHLLLFLLAISVIACGYFIVMVNKQQAPIVHFRDINSFYPTFLCIVVACAATFYASIQMFAPEMWRHFYYHPTLNPFEVPLLLRVFLMSVWAMLIIAVAAVDDTRRHLPMGQALLYVMGLGAVCAANYIVFSVTTLYYVGYLLLVLYVYFALHRFWKNGYTVYLCGNCGAQMKNKGRCPKCGAVNE